MTQGSRSAVDPLVIIETKVDDFEVDPGVKRTPMLVTVDEAHNYLSSPE